VTRILSYVRTQRGLVDYALKRRSVLASLHSGLTPTMDVCDAHPYLLQAAKFHGEATERTCPVCRREPLTEVSWIYGDELGHAAGSARREPELEALAELHAEFTVYVVEVCRTCRWNQLVRSYVLGTGTRDDRAAPEQGRRRQPRRSASR
jgi:hypothetical protein